MAALLVTAKLHVDVRHSDDNDDEHADSLSSKLRQVDFAGTAVLASSITSLVILLDQGGKGFAWRSWWTAGVSTAFAALLAVFVAIEAYVARVPIFALRILRRPNVAASYLVSSLQVTAQLALMFSVPLYFQVTQDASTTSAGVHLIPAVVGNALGGLCAGAFIRRYGHYKVLCTLSSVIATSTHVLLLLTWNGTRTGIWQSWYIFPGGFGTGISGAASFVAMAAALEPKEVAAATAGFMLVVSLAMTCGVTISNSILVSAFRAQLQDTLHGPGAKEVSALLGLLWDMS